jgi:zinc protease
MSKSLFQCIFFFLIFWGGTVFAATATSSGTLSLPELETLPNGLQVAWFVNDQLPVVDLSLIVHAGHRDDSKGKSGTAELLMAVLDRGSHGKSAQKMAHSIEMLGGSRYLSAEDDSMVLGVHGLAPDGEAVLEILRDLSLYPDLLEKEVNRERARIADRWNHIEDYGDTLCALAYRKVITAGTIYGRGSLASLKELKQVNRSDLNAFHQKYFTPKNSLLLVVGRVDRDRFRQKILEQFGAWKGEVPSRTWSPYSDPQLGRILKKDQSSPPVIVVNRPNLTQAQVRIGFRAPGIQSKDYYPLTIANALLGEHFNSRLNSLVRDQLGLTYSIRSGFSYLQDFSDFSIVSSTRNETTGALVQKTIEVLKGLKQGPISSEEIEFAKSYLVGGFPLSTSTLSAIAFRWSMGYLHHLGDSFLNEFVPSVQTVALSEVQSAVRNGFDLDHLVIVVAGNSKTVTQSLQAVGFKSIKQVSVSDLKN